MHQLSKKYSLSALLLISACGGDDSAPVSANQASKSPAPTHQEVAARASRDCTGYSLVGQWHVYKPNEDVITIGADCVVEGYDCGSIGYLNSEAKTTIGIVDFVLLYSASSSQICLPVGAYKCAFDTSNAAYHEMQYSCR